MLKYAIATCLFLCVSGCASSPIGADSLESAQAQLDFALLVPELLEGFVLKEAIIPSTGGWLSSFGNAN